MTKKLSPKFGEPQFFLSVQIAPAQPRCRTIMFAGHETTATTVCPSEPFTLISISTGPIADDGILGAREASTCSRKAPRRNCGKVTTNQVQGEGRFHGGGLRLHALLTRCFEGLSRVVDMLTIADLTLHIGGFEGPSGRHRAPSCTQRRYYRPLCETGCWHFWEGLQRDIYSCGVNHSRLPSRIQPVSVLGYRRNHRG